jgi:protocatechuate 3,4-dioxygenase, alpha subunit
VTATPTRLTATSSQTIGPFFHFGIATDISLGCIGAGAAGERIQLVVRVLDGDGVPVSDALIELYHADADGAYGRDGFCGFGRLSTGADGACRFETIRPGRVPDDRGGRQAPHINLCLFARGILRHLYTRIYFADDPALAEDAILALVPEHRRDTLMARAIAGAVGQWSFEIRLQGQGETVFFDL